MTIEEIIECYEEVRSEYLQFKNIDMPLHTRPDICAMLYLHNLQPGDTDLVRGSSTEEVYFDLDIPKLAETITKTDIIYLIRCGVLFEKYAMLNASGDITFLPIFFICSPNSELD